MCVGGGSGGGDNSGGGPPACTPSCNECGSDGCGGTCANTCGNFYNSCSSGVCQYYSASLSANASTPCITEQQSSRQFTVSGESNYCGDITIDVDYGNNIKDSAVITGQTYSSYNFERTFTIPSSVTLSPEPHIIITVRGNRNSIKDIKDETNYACEKTITLDLTYKNFYYCPDQTYSPDQNIFDIYDKASYYFFYSGDKAYAWDECKSKDTINDCSPNPNDCVDNKGMSFPVNSAFDADRDFETEICYYRDNIQGGWLDPDINEGNCSLINGAIWLDCKTQDSSCLGAIDSFEPGISGLCCGDESNENPVSTKEFKEWDNNYRKSGSDLIEHSACCASQNKCVDETGVCRDEGYEYCLSAGNVRAVCTKTASGYEWLLKKDSSCENGCTLCDINKDTYVNDIDILAIENHYSDTNIDPDYDVNKDNVVDAADRDFCYINYFNKQCSSCGDNILNSGYEQCEEINGNIEYSCPDYFCSSQNHTIMKRSNVCDPVLCECSYDYAECDASKCGGCDANNPCSDNKQECSPYTCSCSDYIPGEELSMHIYENNCQYKLCVSGNKVNVSNVKGVIISNTEISSLSSESLELNAPDYPDSLYIDGDKIVYDFYVKDYEDCLLFESSGDVYTDFKLNNGSMDLSKIYLEPQEQHPDNMPVYFSTDISDSCRICVPSQDVETNITDGIDNDCDGLIDEPYFKETGVYIWEANCNYYLCAYSQESKEVKTNAEIKSETGFYNIKKIGLEQEDIVLSDDINKILSFKSSLINDIDCISFNTDSIMDINLNETSVDNIYIGNRKLNPISNNFRYSSPECNNYCSSWNECGSVVPLVGKVDCSYDKCIFECGGYWVDVDSAYDIMPGIADRNPGDYCEQCSENMECSNYTNKYSCSYDPCYASLTQFGCFWNETSSKCQDSFNYCLPGETLCSDGSCSSDCIKTDTADAGCYGYSDGICEEGEGCDCPDCLGEQASCVSGAVCGPDNLCGCPVGTSLCKDLSCDATCDTHGGKQSCIGIPNNICEKGEGCACPDCFYVQDSCNKGLVCDFTNETCVESKTGKCKPGEALCKDLSCDATCEDHGGKQACIGEPDGVCDFNEGCACPDCNEKRDSCVESAVCDYSVKLCSSKNSTEISNGQGNLTSCVDDDNDGYYKINKNCSTGTDCNDADKTINIGSAEICSNNIDDDCDGLVDKEDEDCNIIILTNSYSVDNVRVFEALDLDLEISNGLDKEISDLKASISLPQGFEVEDSHQEIYNLMPGETRKIEFKAYVLDYYKDKAGLALEISLPKIGIQDSESFSLDVDIPKFLIAPDPRDIGKECIGVYYVINDPSLSKDVDVELNIINPRSSFNKMLFLDYLSSVNTNSIVIKPFPDIYCFLYYDYYELVGYLYKPSSSIAVETAAVSREKIKNKEKRLTFKIEIKRGV